MYNSKSWGKIAYVLKVCSKISKGLRAKASGKDRQPFTVPNISRCSRFYDLEKERHNAELVPPIHTAGVLIIIR